MENINNEQDNFVDTIIDISQKRKRGRPRKNQVIHINDKKKKDKVYFALDDKNTNTDKNEEIILHIPFKLSELNKEQNDIHDNNDQEDQTKEPISNESEKYVNKNIFEKITNNTFTISDMSNDNSSNEDENRRFLDDDIKDLIMKIKEKEEKIKQLEKENAEYKNIVKNTISSTISKVVPMDINFIDSSSGEQIIAEKTDVCCWWCTCEFDGMPWFIPNSYNEKNYYVFGCFCSAECAASYNFDTNDYKTWTRYSLIKKLYNTICQNSDEVKLAPPREALKKFGGHLTIEEFRTNGKKYGKEYRLLIPPMISIIPMIEETCKNTAFNMMKIKTNDNLELKRTKPLPSSKNTLLDIMYVVQK